MTSENPQNTGPLTMEYEILTQDVWPCNPASACRIVASPTSPMAVLNAAKDNVVVFPSRYAGTHADQTYLIGPGKALDPEKYFIVCINMLGSGLSSSPSNTARPLSGPDFPSGHAI